MHFLMFYEGNGFYMVEFYYGGRCEVFLGHHLCQWMVSMVDFTFVGWANLVPFYL